MFQHVLRQAPQLELPERSLVVDTEDDHIGAAFDCLVDDSVPRLSRLHQVALDIQAVLGGDLLGPLQHTLAPAHFV